MSQPEPCECPEPPAGIPAWVMTFADLMSLLMCFFVLLLSFSEMDVMRFKRLAGSMNEAFGVQREVKVLDIPKGTSVIAQEFSPAKPEPTPLNVVRQFTVQDTLNSLMVDGAEAYREEFDKVTAEPAEPAEGADRQAAEDQSAAIAELEAKLRSLVAETRADAETVAEALGNEIASGALEIETRGRIIVIRIREQAAFASGSDEINHGFIRVMAKIRGVLKGVPGAVSIEGHTDNLPISNHQFESNWGLSTARAVAVADELFAFNDLDQDRFRITGFADKKPIADNATADGRSRNRRVELVIDQGLDEDTEREMQAMSQTDAQAVERMRTAFDLQPFEVF